MVRWNEPEELTDEEPVDADEFDDEYDEFDEGEWDLDPNDPSHPDHDLSESATYMWDPPAKPLFLRRGVILTITILVIIGLMLPMLARIL